MPQHIGQAVAEIAYRFYSATPFRLWVGAFVVGFVLERLLRNAEDGQPLRGYLRNVAYSLVYLMVIFLASPYVYLLIAQIRGHISAGPGLMNLQIVDNSTYLNQLIILTLYLLIVDFFQYRWHRLQHVVPFLWEQHVVHHTEEAMNVTTATRHHWSEFIFQSFVIVLPIGILFNITPMGVGIVATAFHSWQFFVH